MKIAIYHGFPSFHFEMLGYLIDYFKHSNIKVDTYSHTRVHVQFSLDLIRTFNIGQDWKEYYEKIFNEPLIWLNPLTINPDNYDLIFLVTDDDFSYSKEWSEAHGLSKIISIDHCSLLRREHAFFRINTRFLSMIPLREWALPCFQAITKIDKLSILSNSSTKLSVPTSNKIKIACIGENIPPSLMFLTELFTNFNELEFFVIARKINITYNNNNDNIHILENCLTKDMMEIVEQCSYMLCVQRPNDDRYNNQSMSGAIPMAFNNGCQLIIPNEWQQHYCFKSAISYNEETKLTLNRIPPLDLIYEETHELINHRNSVFEKVIKLKYSNK